MYILGLYSSWGTSRICPAWSPSEHLLTPALSPFRASVRSHAVRRRLFVVLMTAAHISPDVFSLRKFLSNTQGLFLTVHSNIIHTYYTSHLYARLQLYFIRLVHIFISSDLLGRLAALGSLCPIQKEGNTSSSLEVTDSMYMQKSIWNRTAVFTSLSLAIGQILPLPRTYFSYHSVWIWDTSRSLLWRSDRISCLLDVHRRHRQWLKVSFWSD